MMMSLSWWCPLKEESGSPQGSTFEHLKFASCKLSLKLEYDGSIIIKCFGKQISIYRTGWSSVWCRGILTLIVATSLLMFEAGIYAFLGKKMFPIGNFCSCCRKLVLGRGKKNTHPFNFLIFFLFILFILRAFSFVCSSLGSRGFSGFDISAFFLEGRSCNSGK